MLRGYLSSGVTEFSLLLLWFLVALLRGSFMAGQPEEKSVKQWSNLFLPSNHNLYLCCLFITVNIKSKGCWIFCVELETSHCYLMFVILLLIRLLIDVFMTTMYQNKMWKLCDKVKWVTQPDETISTWIYRAQQKLHCMGSLSHSLSGAWSCSVQWVFRAFSLKTISSTMADEHRACEHSGAFQVEQLNKQIVP